MCYVCNSNFTFYISNAPNIQIVQAHQICVLMVIANVETMTNVQQFLERHFVEKQVNSPQLLQQRTQMLRAM